MRRLSALLFHLAITALLLPSTATAATVLKHDLDSLVRHSDAIVIASVANVEARRHDDGRVYTTVTLEVEEILKGQQRETITIRQVGGRDLEADIATVVPGMPQFEPQERVFLFLNEGSDARPTVTGLSQGKFSIALGPDESTEFVIPRLSGLHLIADHRAIRGAPEPSLPPEELAERHHQIFDQVHELSAFQRDVERIIDLHHEVGQ